jgi:hypothetical protein
MGKKAKLNKLAVFIGLEGAHRILVKLANDNESVPHLEREVDNYEKLAIKISEGNWNQGDIEMIREQAIKRCDKKLENYEKINDENYYLIEETINNIMKDLGLI